MSTPQISICLPVFNGASHLAAAIDSVLAQTFTDFELLIADDGSTDGSADIASTYAARDKRISYWKNATRQGLFGNYNACIKKANGRYIKPFAQDDVLLPDALATLVGVLQTELNVALVSSSRQIIDDAGLVTELKQPIAEDMRAPGAEVIRFHLIGLNNWVGEPSTVMFRREFSGSGFDSSYYHYGDIEYWFRILMNGDFCYLARPLASFRRHAASQTDKNHRELYFALDILRMSSKYRHLLAEFEPDALLKRRLAEKIALEHGHVLTAAEPENLFAHYQESFMSANTESGSELERLKSEAHGFRLLASMSLSTISELIAELDHEKRCRHDEHELFVAEVEKMRQSIYYKLASPLRKLRNVIKGSTDTAP
jgi:glycosyltransferase involved in cell wall biosynthesis